MRDDLLWKQNPRKDTFVACWLPEKKVVQKTNAQLWTTTTAIWLEIRLSLEQKRERSALIHNGEQRNRSCRAKWTVPKVVRTAINARNVCEGGAQQLAPQEIRRISLARQRAQTWGTCILPRSRGCGKRISFPTSYTVVHGSERGTTRPSTAWIHNTGRSLIHHCEDGCETPTLAALSTSTNASTLSRRNTVQRFIHNDRWHMRNLTWQHPMHSTNTTYKKQIMWPGRWKLSNFSKPIMFTSDWTDIALQSLALMRHSGPTVVSGGFGSSDKHYLCAILASILCQCRWDPL